MNNKERNEVNNQQGNNQQGTKNQAIKKLHKLSKISALHYAKLTSRSILFMAATAIYIMNRIAHADSPFGGIERNSMVLSIIWLFFVTEMILRFFPSNLESMGCQKQFSHNFQPTGNHEPILTNSRIVLLIAAGWIGLNLLFGILYLSDIIDGGILLLISLAFSVCDMICILFFCPFQTWFMKNKCCGTCRIYNWDYAMMFTPLIFIQNIYTWSILACGVGLAIRWEIAVYRYPERFSEATNASLSCANCNEKLCHHKKQLRQFLKKNTHLFRISGNMIQSNTKLVKKEKRK